MGGTKMISYNPLWKTLIDRGINKTVLAKGSGISPTIITCMGKNASVSMATIDKICRYLNCRVEDVVECLPDPGEI